MPDPIVPDAQPAASSPAPSRVPALGGDSDPLDALNETDLHHWRMTGETPPADSPVTTSPAASSAAPAVQDPPASTDAPLAAASEPATPELELKAKTKARIDELLAGQSRERDRADRAERRARELETRSPPPSDVRPAASSPAPAGLVKPDPDAFPYGTADPGYLDALTHYTVAATLAQERASWEQGQQETRRREDHARVVSAFEAKAAAARASHADFDAVAMLAPTEIPQGSAADLWVLEDDAGAEILYHLQQPQNTAERRRILALGPRDQLKELVRLGDRLTAGPAAARSTQAPPPPPVLSTRPSPVDPVERALADGDSDDATGAYIAAQNRRDLARLKR